ncbi:MAG: hypothetical protein M3410_04855 [Acidobacteriota bacterium]|nr:hypothetical protein [Acidobacteriota bacterium]
MNRSSRIAVILLAVALFAFHAHAYQEKKILGSGISVAAFSHEGREVAFEVPVAKTYPDGPYVIVWQG